MANADTSQQEERDWEANLTAGIGTTKVLPHWSSEEVRAAQKEYPGISRMLHELSMEKNQPETDGEWGKDGELRRYRQLWPQMEIVDGLLYRRVEKGNRDERLVLVVPRKMRGCLLKLSHNDPCSGHMGINRCLERLQRQYYWPGMATEIQLWIAECEECNRRKTSSTSTTSANGEHPRGTTNGTLGDGYYGTVTSNSAG